jgi:hypothetical protein
MAKTTPSKKRPTKTKQTRGRSIKLTKKQKIALQLQQLIGAARQRTARFLKRRPHRSFRMTARRDYTRSLQLPGYWSFTNYVRSILWSHRWVFIATILTYAALSGLLVNMASQDTYATLSEALREKSGEVFGGDFGALSQAGLLFLTGMTVGFTEAPSELQQVYGALFGLLTWLTTVWLLRVILSGKRPKFRDGLYNAGAPIVSTIIVGFSLLVQMLPGAIGVVLISAIVGSNLAGAIAMIFAVAAGLLILLSLYWATSTLIALVVVTLPGVYPLQAIRAAGDIVIGRRLRILLRWIWLFGITFIIWAIILIPIMILDAWIKGIWPAIQWVPVVPVALLLVGSFSVVFTSSYVYLLYRKVVEDDASPA